MAALQYRVGIAVSDLRMQARDLISKLLELTLFTLQKAGGEAQLLGDALGDQKKRVLEFVGILREFTPLHQALIP